MDLALVAVRLDSASDGAQQVLIVDSVGRTSLVRIDSKAGKLSVLDVKDYMKPANPEPEPPRSLPSGYQPLPSSFKSREQTMQELQGSEWHRKKPSQNGI